MIKAVLICKFFAVFLSTFLASVNTSGFNSTILKTENGSSVVYDWICRLSAFLNPLDDDQKELDGCASTESYYDCQICPFGHCMNYLKLRDLQNKVRKQNLTNETARNPKCPKCDFPIIISSVELYFIVSGLLGMTNNKHPVLNTDDNNPFYSYIWKENVSISEDQKWETLKGHVKYFHLASELQNEEDWLTMYVQLLSRGPDLAKVMKLFNLNVLPYNCRFPKHIPDLRKAIEACGTNPEYADLKTMMETHLKQSEST